MSCNVLSKHHVENEIVLKKINKWLFITLLTNEEVTNNKTNTHHPPPQK